MRRPIRRLRGGVVLVAVVICLIVISMLCAALLRMGLSQRDGARGDERQVQSDWLAESALERAVARLDADPGYQGETWDIPAGELGGSWSGRAVIAVQPIDGHPQSRRVHVRAEFPRAATALARSSKQAVITLSTQSSGDRR